MSIYLGSKKIATVVLCQTTAVPPQEEFIPATESLVYTLSEDKNYYIVGTGFTSIEAIEADTNGGTAGSGFDSTWTGGKLVIPAEYNGKPVLAIAPKAFSNIYDITSVYIFDGLTHIGHRCFQCTSEQGFDITMTSFRLPNTLQNMGGTKGRVMWGRLGLTNFTISEYLELLANSTFGYCSNIATINLRNVKRLENSTFQNCTGLTNVIGNNLINLDLNSFYGCSSLKSIVLPKIQTIGDAVFYNCSALTSVTISSDCVNIGDATFKCGSLLNKTTFTLLGVNPPTITTNTFDTTTIAKIIVPKGYSDAYKTATNWAALAGYIEEAME